MNVQLQRLLQFFESIGWEVRQVPGEPILSIRYRGENGEWTFAACAPENDDVLCLFCRAPMDCPPHRMPEVLRFFNEANLGMLRGAWVLDTEDGEMRFRVGQDVAGSLPDDNLLWSLIHYVCRTMDKYLPALAALVSGEATPEDAVRKVFGDPG